jgi:hypothetical protein
MAETTVANEQQVTQHFFISALSMQQCCQKR